MQYINVDRIKDLVIAEPVQDRAFAQKIEKAIATFDELAKAEHEFFVTRVEPGGSLYDTVKSALGRTGRAFGAARLVHAVQSGRSAQGQNGALASFPFDKWNANERKTAPPLIVEVQGDDLRPASLAEFMDGTQKIVLVVQGVCTPAPLVRLVSPGTFVIQCENVANLARFAEFDGPGIAAIVPNDCALFAHDPQAGRQAGDRINVTHLPKPKARRPVAGLSSAQQMEELQILATLVEVPRRASTAKAEDAKAEDPVDKLAAWLMTQADISDIS